MDTFHDDVVLNHRDNFTLYLFKTYLLSHIVP